MYQCTDYVKTVAQPAAACLRASINFTTLKGDTKATVSRGVGKVPRIRWNLWKSKKEKMGQCDGGGAGGRMKHQGCEDVETAGSSSDHFLARVMRRDPPCGPRCLLKSISHKRFRQGA